MKIIRNSMLLIDICLTVFLGVFLIPELSAVFYENYILMFILILIYFIALISGIVMLVTTDDPYVHVFSIVMIMISIIFLSVVTPYMERIIRDLIDRFFSEIKRFFP